MTAAVALVLGGVLASVHFLGSSSGPDRTSSSPAAAFRTWQAKPFVQGSGRPQCAYGAGKLLCNGSSAVVALGPENGTVLWKHPVAKTRWSGPPVLSGGLVQFTPGENRRAEAVDPASGRTRWQRDLPENSGTEYAGGMLLLTRPNGTVTGMDSSSGRTQWSHRIPDHGQPHIDHFSGDPLAYATSVSTDGTSTHVTALDPVTGSVRWDAHLKGLLKPVGARGGSVFFLSTDPVYLDTTAVVRYVAASGTAHRIPLPAPRQDTAASVRDSTVFLLDSSGALDAVDTDTGKRVWHLETSVNRGSAPVADDRYVYLSAPDGRLLAVNTRDGRLAGQTPARFGTSPDRVAAVLPPPVVAHDHVYATAPDGTVFALDARDPSAW